MWKFRKTKTAPEEDEPKGELVEDPAFLEAARLGTLEESKKPSRTEIINYLLSQFEGARTYLEIGVRNPNDNFDHIIAENKYSVDPGLEFADNPVDFKLTSDCFFDSLSRGEVLSKEIRFDVVFIDGLHLALQVDRDIRNAFKYLSEGGFIVIHDCNPPTEWHARENLNDTFTPARTAWNGTTWKAFIKWRTVESIGSCCIDSDWGVGVLSPDKSLGGSLIPSNPFFEYSEFAANRIEFLNLVSFEEFRRVLEDGIL